MNILGLSAFYHDSAACLIRDGIILAAAQQERFSRIKHDHAFPHDAIEYCLKEAGITSKDLDYVAFYDKPFIKFERILETYVSYSPRGWASFLMAMPLWLKQKLHLPNLIRKSLNYEGKLLFPEHHESHAASAFFPSPYNRAAFLTMDGVGEWTTTSFGIGEGNKIRIDYEIQFPHSLGLLYSAFTYFTGFKVNSGEYKIMGLAPYGEPKYVDTILNELIDIKEDGSFKLNMDYFTYPYGLTMTGKAFEKLFGGPARKPEAKLTQREMDLAKSIQVVTEEVMIRTARHIKKVTGEKYLCLAGGVALNCVGNGRILREGPFEDLWIQPAAGDAGGALGAALFVWYQLLENGRVADDIRDMQMGSYLGPVYNDTEIKEFLDRNGYPYEHLEDGLLPSRVADIIAEGKVIGWFQGRMEFGPRALGARSIIGDARNPKMQSQMNLKIKYRESFRPFAPSVLMEEVDKFFELDRPSPYMLLVANVDEKIRRGMTDEEHRLWGIDKLNVARSEIPAITHVDYSARIQTVHKDTNPLYHEMIAAFHKKTGCPVIVNTSFNVRGEPIVMSPEHAYLCFMRTEMDYLVLGGFLLDKKNQPELKSDTDWRSQFELD
ncbi:MAG: carbamoyltransferase [Desulfomonile tiedjei]|uniref:Carbamoyltransferase n=1 Tax=Desulfomonile tiedjei TaxID=2358 RepID=A0A9D6Z406_9BACT|nr:carbamoyltransferase [Desulfomonile tiedjei]